MIINPYGTTKETGTVWDCVAFDICTYSDAKEFLDPIVLVLLL